MNYKNIVYFLLLLVPTTTTPAIWLRKDPQAIVAGEHNFFFPFLKEENIAIVRNYRQWANEVLEYFADKIKQYPRSAYAENKDPKLVTEAQTVLKKELRQLATALETTPAKKPAHDMPCNKKLSPQQREQLSKLLAQTPAQLFGEPLMHIMMVGIQGPKLEDFKRRAHIEDVYAARTKELNRYAGCAQLSKQDKNLVEQARAHVEKAYHEVIDNEGLSTEKMMENV